MSLRLLQQSLFWILIKKCLRGRGYINSLALILRQRIQNPHKINHCHGICTYNCCNIPKQSVKFRFSLFPFRSLPSFRASLRQYLTIHLSNCCPWEEAGVPGEDPHKHTRTHTHTCMGRTCKLLSERPQALVLICHTGSAPTFACSAASESQIWNFLFVM